jgi:DHA2 family multidrug resistance protein-like MFS transporter
LTLATVLPIIFAIKRLAEGGDSWLAALACVVGLVCGLVFARRQLKLEQPLLDLRLFKLPTLSVALTINALDFLVGFGILVVVAQYLQLVLGLSPLGAGLWGIPPGFGFVVWSLLTSALLKALRSAFVLAGGLLVGAAGLALMAYAIDTHSLILITLGNTMFAIGSAPGTTIVADFVVSSAPEDQSGAASALSETFSEFGGALGIALLGSLATFCYRHELVAALPAGIPAPASHSFGGEYSELVPGQLLRYTNKFDDPNLPGEMQVTVTLKKVLVGTEVNIEQAGVPDAIPPEACYLGWQESLRNLAKLAEPDINQ